MGRTALAAAAVMLFAAFFPAFAAEKDTLQSKTDSAKQDYANASSALDELNQQLEQDRSRADALAGETEALRGQIAEVASSLQAAQDAMAQAQNEADAAEQALEENRQALQVRYDACMEQTAAMEFLGEKGALSLLMSARDMYELLTFWQVLTDLTQANQNALEELDREAGELRQQRDEAEQAVARADEARQALENQQADLTRTQEDLAEALRQADAALDSSQAAAEAQAAVTEEKRRQYEKATAELDAYLRAQSEKYRDPARQCSLEFVSPLPSISVVSTRFGEADAVYGKPHNGTDFPAAAGTPVYAIADGTVTAASTRPSYGNCVQIDHGKDTDGNSYASLYAHLQRFIVSAGQSVQKGQVIGYVGNTGDVRGANGGYHLHLELRINGVRTDPLGWLKG